MRHDSNAHGTPAMLQDVLYVAARAPRPGFTKSRLGRAIGHDRSTALYTAFVEDLAERRAALESLDLLSALKAGDERAPLPCIVVGGPR